MLGILKTMNCLHDIVGGGGVGGVGFVVVKVRLDLRSLLQSQETLPTKPALLSN